NRWPGFSCRVSRDGVAPGRVADSTVGPSAPRVIGRRAADATGLGLLCASGGDTMRSNHSGAEPRAASRLAGQPDNNVYFNGDRTDQAVASNRTARRMRANIGLLDFAQYSEWAFPAFALFADSGPLLSYLLS